PSEILHPFDLRPRVHRKDQFVNVVANNLEVRATESGGNRRRPTQRGHVDYSSDGHLGELGAVGNENDLVIQSFFGKETGVVSDPNADIGSADGTVADPHSVRGGQGRSAEKDENRAAKNGSFHRCSL